MIFPRPLRTGDEILVVSPSSNTAAHLPRRLERGIAELKDKGFKVRLSAHVVDSRKPDVLTVESRLEDLHAGFSDPNVAAIVSTIGGWASHQLLDSLDIDLVRSNPTWFIGYSDSTSLHLFLNSNAGISSIYGPSVLPQFGEYGGVFPYVLDSLLKASAGDGYLVSWPDFRIDEKLHWDIDDDRSRESVNATKAVVIAEGTARGRVLAANLETLLSHAGTRYWPQLRGRILLVELSDSVQEWQAQRLIHQLAQQDGFAELAGLGLGWIPRHIGVDEDSIIGRLRSLTLGLGFPVVAGMPFGHVDPIMSIPLGASAELIASSQNVALQYQPFDGALK